MTNSYPDFVGADPINLKWKVVRGDTSTMRVEFLNNDEVTLYDTDAWTYASTAYDFKGDAVDSLTVTAGVGYVDILITPEISSGWGLGYNSISAELAFDLQVTIDENTIWTPIIGTIVVLSDVTTVGGP